MMPVGTRVIWKPWSEWRNTPLFGTVTVCLRKSMYSRDCVPCANGAAHIQWDDGTDTHERRDIEAIV